VPTRRRRRRPRDERGHRGRRWCSARLRPVWRVRAHRDRRRV